MQQEADQSFAGPGGLSGRGSCAPAKCCAEAGSRYGAGATAQGKGTSRQALLIRGRTALSGAKARSAGKRLFRQNPHRVAGHRNCFRALCHFKFEKVSGIFPLTERGLGQSAKTGNRGGPCAGPPRFMVRAEESGCAARRRRFAAVPARDGLGGRRFGGSRERCEDAAHSGLFPGGAARARAIAGRLSREGFCKKQTGSPRQEVILSVFWERGRHACQPP